MARRKDNSKINIFKNTFDGLEEQLGDPDPVKEVRNYRWALRQQMILFQNFLEKIQGEKSDIEKKLETKIKEFEKEKDLEEERIRTEFEPQRNELQEEIDKLNNEYDELSKTHDAEKNYQFVEQTKKLKEVEDEYYNTYEPPMKTTKNLISQVVKDDELIEFDENISHLVEMTKKRASTLTELADKLSNYSKDMNLYDKDINSYLDKHGLKDYSPKSGTKFDHSKHEPVMIESNPAKPWNTILSVEEAGKIYDKKVVVRAQVVVNLKPGEYEHDLTPHPTSSKTFNSEIKELVRAYNKKNPEIAEIRANQEERRKAEFEGVKFKDSEVADVEVEELETEDMNDNNLKSPETSFDMNAEGMSPAEIKAAKKEAKRQAKLAKKEAKRQAKEAKKQQTDLFE